MRAAAHNQVLDELLDKVGLLLRAYDTSEPAETDTLISLLEDHDEITARIAEGDGDAARLTMARHLSKTRDLRLNALAQSASNPAGLR